ncbi:MAG: hypothetical protein L3J16_00450 [Anaerolineales bacterium]|nr:hypothetical protein [Anaerolineales bacterium]
MKTIKPKKGNTMTTEHNDQKYTEARQSFTGKALSDSQFDESWALAEIMHRGIRKSGSFREKLTDYSHAFTRSEKFDQMKGETIIRDQFKARYGETMNQMRENLKSREANIPLSGHEQALDHARMIGPLIRDGDTMPFYRAHDVAGGALAEKLNITEAGAKRLMSDAYSKNEGRELYEIGKALEKQFHQPVREAVQQAREAKRDQTHSRARA